MWAYAQRDGRPHNIGGALCWMLLRKLRKCRSGTIWGRKNGAPFSAATRPTYTKPGSCG